VRGRTTRTTLTPALSRKRERERAGSVTRPSGQSTRSVGSLSPLAGEGARRRYFAAAGSSPRARSWPMMMAAKSGASFSTVVGLTVCVVAAQTSVRDATE